jgi:hypothetical protein
MDQSDQPEGILITFPVQFLYDLGEGYVKDSKGRDLYEREDCILRGFKDCMRQLEAFAGNPDESIWYHSIGSKPTREVLFAYITILGKVRYRAKVAGWEPEGLRQFSDGRKREAKHWLLLSDFFKAPEEITLKGFQGFRYTQKLF